MIVTTLKVDVVRLKDLFQHQELPVRVVVQGAVDGAGTASKFHQTTSCTGIGHELTLFALFEVMIMLYRYVCIKKLDYLV